MHDVDFFKSAAEKCRENYQRLVTEFAQSGIDPAEVTKSLEYVHSDGKRVWVDAAAFQPTGIALGFPLPDFHFSKLLFQTAERVADKMAARLRAPEAGFAFVPREGYHITLVNYSHFDCTKGREQVASIPAALLTDVENLVGRRCFPVPRITFKGLILTKAGRLIVPGYSINPVAFILRRELTALDARLGTNLPCTLHIKLGHFLSTLKEAAQNSCQQLLEESGRVIEQQLEFADIHTPVARIKNCFYGE